MLSLLFVGLAFLTLNAPANAQPYHGPYTACSPQQANWGGVRVTTTYNAVSKECEMGFCFGTTQSYKSFAMGSPEHAALDKQNCGTVNQWNTLASPNCPGSTYVRGILNQGCKVCTCDATKEYDFVWKEQNFYGRKCQAYECTNIMGNNCTADQYAYLPQTNRGMYMPNGLSGVSSTGWYDEFSPAHPDYVCPYTSKHYCVNNPDGTKMMNTSNAINYHVGSFYELQKSNKTMGCMIQQCTNATDPAAWVGHTFMHDVDFKADTALMAFVKKWCPVSSNWHLSGCMDGATPIYFDWGVDGNTNCMSNLCSRLHCACPAGKMTKGDLWYTQMKMPITPPSGPIINVMDKLTGFTWSCDKYECSDQSGWTRNYTISWGSAARIWSNYGPINPCDAATGFTTVGKYWSGNALLDFSVHQRSAVMMQITDGIPIPAPSPSPGFPPFGNPLGPSPANGDFRYDKLENSTCAALGYGTCWEVKPYTKAVYGMRSCATWMNPVREITSCTPSQGQCNIKWGIRDAQDKTKPGDFVGTRIQCFANGENYAMQPYCKKNQKLQDAYQNLDMCMHNQNYIWNVQPTFSCGDVALWSRNGNCQKYRTYVQYRGDCYCKWVADMNRGSTSGDYMQSAQSQFYRIFAPVIDGALGYFTQMGCQYTPITCDVNSGTVSFSIIRSKVSGTLDVMAPCADIDVYKTQRTLQSYWGTTLGAGVATSGYSNGNVRISKLTTSGTTCKVQFWGYLQNLKYAEYGRNNLTEAKAAKRNNLMMTGAVANSMSGVSVTSVLQSGASALVPFGALATVSVLAMFL